jgi:23S rRNA pseudouridine2605 synthase
MTLIRLNKYLAEQGIASRREADRLIADGQVSVNGKKVTEMGVKVNPSRDKVKVSDKALSDKKENAVYIMLNKPEGYVTSVKRTRIEKKIVTDLIDIKKRVFPVGRLDKDTTGLLILTNDGTLTFKLTHPSSESDKEYEAVVNGVVTKGAMKKLERGVKLKGERTRPAKVKKIGNRIISIILTEGKNRQVRRICQKVGLEVFKLKRIRIKELTLGKLPVGKWRFLTDGEVELLKK